MSQFIESYLQESIELLRRIDVKSIEQLVHGLSEIQNAGGRLFILGVGGSAGHASHAVNDFRKLCRIESYTPSDNASELTARINDEGWDTCYAAWLDGSHLQARDGLLVLSVGGGDRERNVSPNLVHAMDHARNVGAAIFGVVGRDGGYTGRVAKACVIVPPLYSDHVTPHTEGLCSVILHLVVTHPLLKRAATKSGRRRHTRPSIRS